MSPQGGLFACHIPTLPLRVQKSTRLLLFAEIAVAPSPLRPVNLPLLLLLPGRHDAVRSRFEHHCHGRAKRYEKGNNYTAVKLVPHDVHVEFSENMNGFVWYEHRLLIGYSSCVLALCVGMSPSPLPRTGVHSQGAPINAQRVAFSWSVLSPVEVILCVAVFMLSVSNFQNSEREIYSQLDKIRLSTSRRGKGPLNPSRREE